MQQDKSIKPYSLSISRNFFWNLSGQSLEITITIITTPYIIYNLGVDLYGLFLIVGITTNYFWFMELGLGQATVKYISEYTAIQDWNEVNKIFWVSIFLYLILGLVTAATFFLFISILCVQVA